MFFIQINGEQIYINDPSSQRKYLNIYQQNNSQHVFFREQATHVVAEADTPSFNLH